MRIKAISTVIVWFLLSVSNSFVDSCDKRPAPVADVTAQAVPKLTGGFIEYRNSMRNFNDHWGTLPYEHPAKIWTPYPVDWAEVVRSMHRAGMDTIIIKRSAVQRADLPVPSTAAEADYEFYRVDDKDPTKDIGPTEAILTAADQNKMEVYIGLWEDDKFEDADLSETYLKVAAEKNRELARKLWPLYRRHESFKGWYVPNEPWNIPSKAMAGDKLKTKLVRDFFKSISEFCKKDLRSGKKVAAAAYFEPKIEAHTTTPEDTAESYKVILDGSGLDILMLQDGVGVRGWDQLKEFFRAYRAAVEHVNDKRPHSQKLLFWSDLENFAGQAVADVGRIRRQLNEEREFVSKFVTFDYYHYMNPVVPDCRITVEGAVTKQTVCQGVEPGCGMCRDRFGVGNARPESDVVVAPLAERKRLYDDYIGGP
jgi:hypothetical protein